MEQPTRRPYHTQTLSVLGAWIEPVQVYTQEYAIYVANPIQADSRAVIEVVRYRIALACFPNKETVDWVERQITHQQKQK